MQAITLNPRNATFYTSRGNAYAQIPLWDKAFADHNKVTACVCSIQFDSFEREWLS